MNPESNKKYSDEEIITGLQAGGDEQRKFQKTLYEQNMFLIKIGSKKHSLIVEKSASAYSDAIIAVIGNIINRKFENRGVLESYIKGIFHNKCIDEIRNEKTYRGNMHREGVIDNLINTMPDKTADIIRSVIKKQEWSILLKKLAELGEKCYQLLMLWCDRYKDDEIAQKMGYSTPQVVRGTRARCLEKLQSGNRGGNSDL